MNFTDEQLKVINARNTNVLVSAAAGSGKTAVLVERILERIMDMSAPIDIDRLLVMTFTRAAAAQMRDRLVKGIQKALDNAAKEGNHKLHQHLIRQTGLIRGAYISTIDGFCTSILRDHFDKIGLDPAFRVGQDGELKLIRNDALNQILELYYEEGSAEFFDFLEAYSVRKNDKDVEELILKLYDYSQSKPFPKLWLSDCEKIYEAEDVKQLFNEPLINELMCYLIDKLHGIMISCKRALDICNEPDGPYMHGDLIEKEFDHLQDVYNKITECENNVDIYETLRECIKAISFGELSRKKDTSVSSYKRDAVKMLRDDYKKQIKAMENKYLYSPAEELLTDVINLKDSVRMIVRLVNSFADCYMEKKSEKGLVDFSDLEHLALQVLYYIDEDGNIKTSRAADEYRLLFEEIMVDEYQDSNEVQEYIVNAIAKKQTGKHNLFFVGDVKQSIYRFRLACPRLFTEKMDTYKTLEGCERLDLHKNFRSRSQVLDFTNFLFKQLMVRNIGGVEYDEDSKLVYGNLYDEVEDINNNAKVLLISPDELMRYDNKELEAIAVACHINKLIKDKTQVYDTDSKAMRALRYSDIAILLRATEGWDKVFRNIFEKYDIPVYMEEKKGYFESYEVDTVLKLLLCINNMRDDETLAAVLRGPFGGFSDEELALVRIQYPEGYFYNAVLDIVEMDENKPGFNTAQSAEIKALQENLQNFLRKIETYRRMSVYTSVHELLAKIIDDYHLDMHVLSLDNGRQRYLNLNMLLKQAMEYEKTSYKGLFHFVRYIEQLKKYEIDYGQAPGNTEADNAVRVMTIHKSKGLEFPVCFVCGCSKKFNQMDTNSRVIFDSEDGIGLDHIDKEKRIKSSTIIKLAMSERLKRENIGEELRVLYVALTRAREKLFVTGIVDDNSINKSGINLYQSIQGIKSEALSELYISAANSYMDWILLALCRNRCMEELMDRAGVEQNIDSVLFNEMVPASVERITIDDLTLIELNNALEINERRDELLELFEKEKISNTFDDRFLWRYPYSINESEYIPAKVSVSYIKHAAMEEAAEGFAGEMVGIKGHEEDSDEPIPAFIKGDEPIELIGSLRGTAYHRFFELIDYSKELDREELIRQRKEMVDGGFLDSREADAVEIKDMCCFIKTDIAKRMAIAARDERLYREQPFTIAVPANEVVADFSDADERTILVQGIIDAFFEEEDGYVIVDYKTDRIRHEKELVDRYNAQLHYYAKALSQITGKVVKDKIIYSVALGKQIRL